MSLASQVQAGFTRVGQEIKALRLESPGARLVRMSVCPGGMGQSVAADAASASQWGVRLPFRIPVDAIQWRLKLRNYNIANGAKTALTGQGVIFGQASLDSTGAPNSGFVGNAATSIVGSAFTIPGDGSWYATPWQAAGTVLAGKTYMLGFGYTAGTAQVLNTTIGKCWTYTTSAAAINAAQALSVTVPAGVPIDWCIEYETMTSRTTVLWAGDSISEGVVGAVGTSTTPAIAPDFWHNSWPAQWAAGNNGLVNNISAAGFTINAMVPTTFPDLWTRIDHVNVGTGGYDAGVFALGSNSINGSVALATCQTQTMAVMDKMRSYMKPNAPLYVCTVLPRTFGATPEGIRTSYNNWLRQLPYETAGCIEIAGPSMSSHAAPTTYGARYTTDTIHPSYEGRGVLLNAAGSVIGKYKG